MSTDTYTQEIQDWEQWRTRRTASVGAPYGPLALLNTHWLADFPEGRLPAIPGTWVGQPDGGGVLLTAAQEDGLIVDGLPFAGEAVLHADSGPVAATRVAYRGRRFFVLVREGSWAVRDFDPEAPARAAFLGFSGIEATAYDPSYAVPGVFTPYGQGRSVRVESADGHERGLDLDGELAFRLGGEEHRLRVTVEADGSLWAVFADSTSGDGSYRFRFLRPAAPGADGRTTVDFNRALLPPCAFADHFLCPFPPPGNALTVPVAAGERRLVEA